MGPRSLPPIERAGRYESARPGRESETSTCVKTKNALLGRPDEAPERAGHIAQPAMSGRQSNPCLASSRIAGQEADERESGLHHDFRWGEMIV